MTDHKPLSTRHERFVQEYLRDGNATRAYVRAGYSPRHAQSSASRLLAQPPIEAAVTAGRQRLAEALEVSVERLGREYAKIAFASVRDFVDTGDDGRLRIDLDKASQAQQEGIVDLTVTDHGKASQRVRLKLGKLQALAALTRHVGLFTRKPEPGLTAEDRARYQATIARHERNWEHGLNQLREVAGERDKARIALAAAQATINRLERQAAARAEEPPPGPGHAPSGEPPEAEIVLHGLGPADPPGARLARRQPRPHLDPDAPREVPLPAVLSGLYPNARLVWSGGRKPGDPPDSAEILKSMSNHGKPR